MTHPWFQASAAPRVLAHRGLVPPDAEGVAENTLAAFAAAHAAGATYVESDCHLTADGEVILFHDDDLVRVAGDPRRVADVGLRELQAIMGTRGGLLTLAEALDSFPTLRFNLDVKVEAAAAPVGRAVAAHAERVLLTSFSDERRRVALRSAADGGGSPATSGGTRTIARVLGAVASRSERLARRALAGVDALQVPERHRGVRIVTRRLLDAAHRSGVEVHVWTVNDAGDMRRLLEMGVDGLVTDRADTALDVLSGRA
ncbi:glycerophosphodiester phosphodiesterase [Microbacterium saccharophilum]|uniref:Glycerophosphodiester phosphodiesterase n=1 Tax=Microbacterium saccharophilum TaxID=1213358 RepID=A0A5C8HUW8_9MICO|nr:MULTISPECIES: glycerophosphodiester phosphodiesterase family protein [Microbacterium]TXK08610.1 glycerophosphodiester phosphodiesterase [Microbacterium saccharophilum]GEP49005.1 glycerophosphoryl diester phosphodiesterase [Microbacterium saccharophilum]SFI34431.1 glycerophosphoryl diester phosphodiesterase [Microbacterium saccharophilum]